MSYLVFDTETSGLPDWSRPAEADGQPRLASWCFIFLDTNMVVENRWSGLVRPDGWIMSAEAEKVNGLTMARLMAEGSSVNWPLSLLVLALQQRRTLVAHNLSFDAKIMRGELRRAGLTQTAEQVRDGICTMLGLMNACALPHPSKPGRFKWPRLSEAVQTLFGETLEGAHDAATDAEACCRLLSAMRDRQLLPLAA